ncbi:MAG: hypothetical protein OXT49_00740 [Gammaproteobacteria bacterium]|nr:hypothetical protein [Gammaproteobacteria bacterium]
MKDLSWYPQVVGDSNIPKDDWEAKLYVIAKVYNPNRREFWETVERRLGHAEDDYTKVISQDVITFIDWLLDVARFLVVGDIELGAVPAFPVSKRSLHEALRLNASMEIRPKDQEFFNDLLSLWKDIDRRSAQLYDQLGEPIDQLMRGFSDIEEAQRDLLYSFRDVSAFREAVRLRVDAGRADKDSDWRQLGSLLRQFDAEND